ncbi:hypothetical protein X797_008704 [Metarhizium robertsii]|uniref:Uncharacterized protein n=1 Tax=Metarhizium robertsii TaxID=568076 RepID=A0A0A1URL2_9HYPO|nr:hypothetical protein X797_008704 [Metarhizium robertsii]
MLDTKTFHGHDSVIESLIPPGNDGQGFHLHEMQDEVFYVTVGRKGPFGLFLLGPFRSTVSSLPTLRKKGKVGFRVPRKTSVHAAAGEMVTVPVRLPHKFSNPFNETVFIDYGNMGCCRQSS